METDKRLGARVARKDNLSEIGKIFAQMVCDVYNHGGANFKCCGFGSTAIGENEYVSLVDVGEYKVKHEALAWLVNNGYLFCYKDKSIRVPWGRRSYQHRLVNMYGITKKGWAIAHLYVKEEVSA